MPRSLPEDMDGVHRRRLREAILARFDNFDDIRDVLSDRGINLSMAVVDDGPNLKARINSLLNVCYRRGLIEQVCDAIAGATQENLHVHGEIVAVKEEFVKWRDEEAVEAIPASFFEMPSPPRDEIPIRSVSNTTNRSRHFRPPRLLPYLTDRTEQQRRITNILQAQIDSGHIAPIAFFIAGSEDQCPDSFVEQVQIVQLPKIMLANGLKPAVFYTSLRWATSDQLNETLDADTSEQFEEIKAQLHLALSVKTTAHKSTIENRLVRLGISVLFHVSLDLANWGPNQVQLITAWLQWLKGLDLAAAQTPILILVSIVYPSGWLQRIRYHRLLARLKNDIRQFAGDVDFGSMVHALPNLQGVRFGDVEQWIREYVEDADREILRHLVRRHFTVIFGFGERSLSMARTARIVKDALNVPSVRAGLT
jgi:hypothetical protein